MWNGGHPEHASYIDNFKKFERLTHSDSRYLVMLENTDAGEIEGQLKTGLGKIKDAESPHFYLFLQSHGNIGSIARSQHEKIPYEDLFERINGELSKFSARTNKTPEVWIFVDACSSGSAVKLASRKFPHWNIVAKTDPNRVSWKEPLSPGHGIFRTGSDGTGILLFSPGLYAHQNRVSLGARQSEYPTMWLGTDPGWQDQVLNHFYSGQYAEGWDPSFYIRQLTSGNFSVPDRKYEEFISEILRQVDSLPGDVLLDSAFLAEEFKNQISPLKRFELFQAVFNSSKISDGNRTSFVLSVARSEPPTTLAETEFYIDGLIHGLQAGNKHQQSEVVEKLKEFLASGISDSQSQKIRKALGQ